MPDARLALGYRGRRRTLRRYGRRARRDRGRALSLAPLRHTLEVVDFLAEEPTDFGISTVGSRAIAGALSSEMLALRDAAGLTLAEAIVSVGGNSSPSAPRADIGLYLELHIEQGPVLEREGLHLGVVTAITGICRFRVRVLGRPDHAGTMPMSLRRDALTASADMILALEQLWSDGSGVGTVGRVAVLPNATNVIPGQVDFTAEMRSTDAATLEARQHAFVSAVRTIADRRDGHRRGAIALRRRAGPHTRIHPIHACRGRAVARPPASPPASYAGHDANQLAKLAPIGMLFIPSQSGRSHCPEEWTDLADVALGARALGEAVLQFDERLACYLISPFDFRYALATSLASL